MAYSKSQLSYLRYVHGIQDRPLCFKQEKQGHVHLLNEK